MVTAGDRVLVAVSGGPDSVCLLDVLCELCPQFGASVAGVAHLNHKLRGHASDEDERFVAAMSLRYELPFYREEANLSGQGNLEEAARQARRNFFSGLIREGSGNRVATGHTLDDQAETVLFRLLRGTGPGGIVGILPVTDEGLIRPLLGVTRVEVEEYLKSRAIDWRQDATNLDPRFSRNRIRNELLPQLAREWNPRISESLARFADIAGAEERWWEAEVDRIATKVLTQGDGGIEVRVEDIAEMPKALARRLIRRAIRQVQENEGQPDFEHVERVLELVKGDPGEGRVEIHGMEAVRSFRVVRFQRVETERSRRTVSVDVPGRYPWAGSIICFDIARFQITEEPCLGAVCASLKLSGEGELTPLELRTWRAGDHYCPAGKSRHFTIHELFQRAQVPSWRRHSWPVVTAGSRIVWVRQFGAAAEFAAEDGPGPVLRIWEEKSSNNESFPSGLAS
jgi:tRNA(Ile)-lysidine synthase